MDKSTVQQDDSIGAKVPAHIEPIGPIAEGIAARIATERERLAVEEKREHELTEDRKRLLTAGTDQEVDECERGIDASRSSQMRSLERLELLTAQLEQANVNARNADLDAIAARAEAAQAEGARLIRTEYPKLASPLGALLKRLLLIDAAIERDNRTLHRAGREPVPASNAVRCTPGKYIDFLKTISVHPLDPRHPLHAKAIRSRRTNGMDEHELYVNSDDHRQVIDRADIKEQAHERVGSDFPDPLYEAIVLPPAEPRPYEHATLPKQPIPQPYFEHNKVEITDADIDALFAELLGTSAKAATKRKAA